MKKKLLAIAILVAAILLGSASCRMLNGKPASGPGSQSSASSAAGPQVQPTAEPTAVPAPTAAPTAEPTAAPTTKPAGKPTATIAPTPAVPGGETTVVPVVPSAPTATPAPVVAVEEILPVTGLAVGETQLLTLASDPDTGVTFTAVSDAEGVAAVTVNGTVLQIEAVGAGTATVTVTAAAEGYTSGTATVAVTVVQPSTQIMAAANGSDIAAVDNDARTLTAAPYIYAEFILDQITAQYGNAQSYQILRAGSPVGNLAYVLPGDVLRVDDGSTTADYAITTTSLLLDQSVMTAGAVGDIVLLYHVDLPVESREELYGTFTLTLPEGITATAEDTINVVGRGEIGLSAAALAAHEDYRYSGLNYTDAVLSLSADGSTVTYADADFRPDNGVDVIVTLKNKTVPAQDATFTAGFTVCDANGTATGTVYNAEATLTAVQYPAALRRTVNDASYTDLTAAAFTAQGADDALVNIYKNGVWQRTELTAALTDGETVSAANGGFALAGLAADTTYRVQLCGENGTSEPVSLYTGKFDVTDFGAKADGSTDDAAAINAAIAAAAKQGGGTVVLGNGKTYASTSIHMLSNVHLLLTEGVTLNTLPGCDPAETVNPPFGTAQDPAYNTVQNTFIWGSRVENVAILGENALIDGCGNLKTGSDKKPEKMFSFKLSSNIRICGVSEEKPLKTRRWGHYMSLTTGCDDVLVQYILADQTSSSAQRDGVNIIGCRDVKVLNCDLLYLYDDVVKLGSTLALGFPRGCDNILVDDLYCVTAGGSGNLFQLGSETIGDFKNLTIRNIVLERSADKAGISIAVNDGAVVSDVLIENAQLKGGRGGIFLSVCDRNTKSVGGITARLPDLMRRPGTITGVTIKNTTVENQALSDTNCFPIILSGYEGHYTVGSIETGKLYPITDITLDNVKVINTATGKAGDLQTVLKSPTNGCYNPNSYPNVGALPAYGILMRDVDGVTITNCDLSYSAASNYRYAMVLDNAANVTVTNTTMEAGKAPGVIQVRGNSSYDLQNVRLVDTAGTEIDQSPVTQNGTLTASDSWLSIPAIPESVQLTLVANPYKAKSVNESSKVVTVNSYTTYADLINDIDNSTGQSYMLYDANGKPITMSDGGNGTVAAATVTRWSTLITTGHTLKVTSAGGTATAEYTFRLEDDFFDVMYEAEDLAVGTQMVLNGLTLTNENKAWASSDADAGGWGVSVFRDCSNNDSVTINLTDLPAGSYKMVYRSKGHARNERAVVSVTANGTMLGSEVYANDQGAGYHDYPLPNSFAVGTDGKLTVVVTVTNARGSQFHIDNLHITRTGDAPAPSTPVDLTKTAGATKVSAIDLTNRVITTNRYTTFADLLNDIDTTNCTLELLDANGNAVTVLYKVDAYPLANLQNGSSQIGRLSALVGEGYTLKATSGSDSTVYTFAFTSGDVDVTFEAEELTRTLSGSTIQLILNGTNPDSSDKAASGWAVMKVDKGSAGDSITFAADGLPAGIYKLVLGSKSHKSNARASLSITANSTLLATGVNANVAAGGTAAAGGVTKFVDIPLDTTFVVGADGKATVTLAVETTNKAQFQADTLRFIRVGTQNVALSTLADAAKISGINTDTHVITTNRYTTYGDLLREIDTSACSIELLDANGSAVTTTYNVVKGVDTGMTKNQAVPHYSAMVGSGYTLKATAGGISTVYTFAFTDGSFDVIYEGEELTRTLGAGGTTQIASEGRQAASDKPASGWGVATFRYVTLGDVVTMQLEDIPAGTYKLEYRTKGHSNGNRVVVDVAVNGKTLGTVDANTGAQSYTNITPARTFTVGADGKATVTVTAASNCKNAESNMYHIDSLRIFTAQPDPSETLAVASGAAKVSAVDTDRCVITTNRYTTYADLLRELNAGSCTVELLDADGNAVTIPYMATAQQVSGTPANVPHLSAVAGSGYTLKVASDKLTTEYTFAFADGGVDLLLEAEELSYTATGTIQTFIHGKSPNYSDADASGWAVFKFDKGSQNDTVTFSIEGLPAGSYRLNLGTKSHKSNARASLSVTANDTLLASGVNANVAAGGTAAAGGVTKFVDIPLDTVFTVGDDGKATVVLSIETANKAQFQVDYLHLVRQ